MASKAVVLGWPSASDVAANTSAIATLQTGKADLEQPVVDIATTTYTIQASDSGKLLRFTHASGCAVTVPDTIAPSSGKCIVISLRQTTSGQVTVAGSGSMTVDHPPALDAATREQHSEITLRIYSTTSSDLSGDLAAV